MEERLAIVVGVGGGTGVRACVSGWIGCDGEADGSLGLYLVICTRVCPFRNWLRRESGRRLWLWLAWMGGRDEGGDGVHRLSLSALWRGIEPVWRGWHEGEGRGDMEGMEGGWSWYNTENASDIPSFSPFSLPPPSSLFPLPSPHGLLPLPPPARRTAPRLSLADDEDPCCEVGIGPWCWPRGFHHCPPPSVSLSCPSLFTLLAPSTLLPPSNPFTSFETFQSIGSLESSESIKSLGSSESL